MTSIPDRTKTPGSWRGSDRGTAALLLAVVAATHLALVPEHLEEAPYVGWLFLALAVTSLVLAAALLRRDSPLAWGVTAAVATAALAAYLVSRTIGLPGLADEVGSWTEPLSFPALTAELLLAALAVGVVRRERGAVSGWASPRSRAR